MAKNIEKNQSDAAQLHAEILQIAEENRKIIDHADDYRERWQTVFPDGTLLELCQEFECCPALIFVALDSIDGHNTPTAKEVSSVPIIAIDVESGKSQRFCSQADAIRTLGFSSAASATMINKAAKRNAIVFGYKWCYACLTMVERISLICSRLLSYGGIYKIEHKYNGKKYIGQTQVSFKARWNEHKNHYKRNKQYPLYKAFDQYGIENFQFSIIEILLDSSKESILHREEFYINFYSSQCKNGGLNFDRPKWNKKLDNDIEEAIFQDLLNGLSNSEIVDKYGISSGLCSHMRSGRRHRREGIDYPILSLQEKEYFNKYMIMYDLLMDVSFSFDEIAKIASLNERSVREMYNHHLPSKIADRFPYFQTAVFPERSIVKPRCNLDKNNIIVKYGQVRHSYGVRQCLYCNKDFEAISNKQKYCSPECANQAQRKAIRPSRDLLKQMIRKESFCAIARKYNVTDNSIRKWCKELGLPTSTFEIASYTDDEWEQEIWNDSTYEKRMCEIKSKPDYKNIIKQYLTTRNTQLTLCSNQIDMSRMSYTIDKYSLRKLTPNIYYYNTCCYLQSENIYFRSGIDAATWVFNNFPHDVIPSANPKSLSTRIGDFFRQGSSTATLTLPGLSTGSPATLTFTHIPEEEFYSIIQHHHVVSYAFDPKWRTIVEDPSLLPDFISLDDLPWVEEFKKFYGMD